MYLDKLQAEWDYKKVPIARWGKLRDLQNFYGSALDSK
jgi:hypothetical protein